MVDERSGDRVDTAPGKDRERSKAACPHAGLLTTSNSLPGATLDPDLAAFARPTAISSWPEPSPRIAAFTAGGVNSTNRAAWLVDLSGPSSNSLRHEAFPPPHVLDQRRAEAFVAQVVHRNRRRDSVECRILRDLLRKVVVQDRRTTDDDEVDAGGQAA